VGNELELMQAGSIKGRRGKIVDKDAIAAPFELLSQKKSCCFLGNVSVGLISKAEDRDRVARRDHPLHLLHQLLLCSLVYPIRSLSERRLHACLPGRVRQQSVVARETGASVAQAGA